MAAKVKIGLIGVGNISPAYIKGARAFEILELTPPLRALIEQPTANLLAEAVSNGMSTLHDDALRLCAAGTTSSDEVRRALGRGLQPLAGVEQGLQ